jgi:Fe-S-cluster containining protein
LLALLRQHYAAIDRELDGWSCSQSTDCCRFGVTGREPYPTTIEVAELERAVRARGGLAKRRSLPVAGERRCALLGDDGRCVVYASRPYGCRTFFCERGEGPSGERGAPARQSGAIGAQVKAIASDIASLSARYTREIGGQGGGDADPGPRPLSRVTATWVRT